ncbi:MAG TPA: hypothetical protein VFH62_04035 [Dehalococcoidia bacterium]|nr:hypothetical protein [Dehalococcoidia bacterium]
MKYGLRFGVILLVATAGLWFAIIGADARSGDGAGALPPISERVGEQQQPQQLVPFEIDTRPRAIELKATPERIACDGNEATSVRVRISTDAGQPVLDGTYVEFVTEGDGYGWFSEQQVVTSNGEASTDVWFQAYDVAFPPFAFDVRATAGMLSGSIRVYCEEPAGCVSPPPAPGDTLSPPCEPPATSTPQPPFECVRGRSRQTVSPPCEPGRPLSPPGCTNGGGSQSNTRNCPPTIEPPASPPQCVESPSPESVSPPCATPTPEPPSPPACDWPFSPPNCFIGVCIDFESGACTFTPTATSTPLPARMALDCDIEAAGIQEDCGPLPDGTTFVDVGIILENLSGAPIYPSVFEAHVFSSEEHILHPIDGSGVLDNNPDFNEDALGTNWGCTVNPDADESPSSALSGITCFDFGFEAGVEPYATVTLATIRYDFGPDAAGERGYLEFVRGGVGTIEGSNLASCRDCTSVDIQLPSTIAPTTATPTSTPILNEEPARAIDSFDATGTPENAHFAAIDCDLAKPGLQDRCSYGVDDGLIEVGFAMVANVANCGICDVNAFNFLMSDPDRTRLDPPVGNDGNLNANPNFNEALLTQNWSCLPPPPDNNRLPDNSLAAESFLSCYSPAVPGAPWPSGAIVLGATIRYRIPEGTLPGHVVLGLSGTQVGDHLGFSVIDCGMPDPTTCRPATITLVDTSADATATNTPIPTATPTPNGSGIRPFEITLTDTPTSVPTTTPTPNGSSLIPLAACADVTGDGIVRLEDAAVITSQVGKRDDRYDITNDGKVNVKDVLASIRQLNRTC